MFKRFVKNNKTYISFETVTSNEIPYKIKTITRRLYPCNATKTHGNYYFINHGCKFYPYSDAIQDI